MLYTAEHNTRRSEQRIDSPLFRQRHGGKPAATETQKATERAGTDHNRARAAKKWCAKRRIKAQAQGVEGNFAHGKGFRAQELYAGDGRCCPRRPDATDASEVSLYRVHRLRSASNDLGRLDDTDRW